MKIDLNYLEMCRDTYQNLINTKELLAKATRPVVTDITLIQSICDVVKAAFDYNEKPSVVVRAQEFVILYLYAPSKLISKESTHSGVLNEFMRVTGANKFDVSRYKNELVAYYKINKGFRRIVDEAMRVVTEELLQ